MLVGNDISAFQGTIAWDLYAKNTNFVLMKASEGVGFTDAKFYEYQQEARKRSLPCGFYHFAHPELGNTPQAEAAYFLTTIGDLHAGEALALDYEVGYTGDVVGWCKAFLDEIQAKTGIKPFLYLNQALCTQYNWTPVITADYALWIAAYTGDPRNNDFNGGEWHTAAMQQWTDAQTVPGIADKVDGDVFFGTLSQFKAYGLKPTPPSTPPAPPSSPTPPSAPTQPANDPCAPQNTRIENLLSVTTQYSKQLIDQQQVILALQQQIQQLTLRKKVAIDYIQEWFQQVLKGGK